jgi:hypothetical protein
LICDQTHMFITTSCSAKEYPLSFRATVSVQATANVGDELHGQIATALLFSLQGRCDFEQSAPSHC